MSNMTIRQISFSDIKPLSKIILELYEEAPYFLTFKEKPSIKTLILILSTKVAMAEDKKIMDMVATDAFGTLMAECEILPKTGKNIIGILVKKEFRGNGVGSTLLNFCIDNLRKLGALEFYAEIDARNHLALSFFKKNGFKQLSAVAVPNSDNVQENETKIITMVLR